MSIGKFPKIWALGHRHTKSILEGPVEITEKIDGSQFGFGKVNNNVFCRSKNHELDLDNPDKMFKPGVSTVLTHEHLIPNNIMFYGETLAGPKHNVLKYDRAPEGNIALFACLDLTTGLFLNEHQILTD